MKSPNKEIEKKVNLIIYAKFTDSENLMKFF